MTEATLRNVTPADVPAIWRLAAEQNERDGTDLVVPRIFDDGDRLRPNIPLALKMVVDGKLVQAHIFECVPELMTFGAGRRATALSFRHLPAAMWQLETMGYAGFTALVPVSRIEAWEPIWKERLKMLRGDARVAHYYRDFRGEQR